LRRRKQREDRLHRQFPVRQQHACRVASGTSKSGI
jgi:hypothetical protein